LDNVSDKIGWGKLKFAMSSFAASGMSNEMLEVPDDKEDGKNSQRSGHSSRHDS